MKRAKLYLFFQWAIFHHVSPHYTLTLEISRKVVVRSISIVSKRPHYYWRWWRFSIWTWEIGWSSLNRYILDTYWSENWPCAFDFHHLSLRIVYVWSYSFNFCNHFQFALRVDPPRVEWARMGSTKRPRPAIQRPSTALLSRAHSGLSE